MCTISGWSAGRPFSAKIVAHRFGIARVSRKPVNGLGGQADDFAATQRGDGRLDAGSGSARSSLPARSDRAGALRTNSSASKP